MKFNRNLFSCVLFLALPASFGAGWQMHAGSEAAARARWLPPAGASQAQITPLVRTADGHLSPSLVAAHRTYPPSLKPYETLDEVRRDIKENFVKTQIDEKELTYGAIRGMLRSLGDRFTRFMTPEELADFNTKNQGEYPGIGIRIDIKDDYLGSPAAKPYNASRPYIVEPIPGGPADKAGLVQNDVILEINGKSTANMSEDAVVAAIKGERGSPIKLKVERRIPTKNDKGEVVAPTGPARAEDFKVLEVTLKRDVIEVHPVKLEWLPNNIAWLRLDEFNEKSDTEMKAALREVQKGKDGQGAARGLILDLRDDPGGLLNAAVDIGSYFVPDGPIVYTMERGGQERPYEAENDRFMNLKMPITVLVNGYSASAAEILAGALKDNGRATVVGEPSFGKASVQVLIELKNGGALVITTAKYLTPARHDISEKGIAPDVLVKPSPEDEQNPPGRGAQLNKAVAVITQKLGTVGTVAERPAGS